MEQDIVLSTGEVKPLTLEDVRARLYKAVRATVLASPDPEERWTQLTGWYKDLLTEGMREATFPEELAEGQKKALQAGWQRAVIRARRLAGELFLWPDPDFDWVKAISRAVDEVVQSDGVALTRQRLPLTERPPLTEADREALLHHLLRRSWCGEAAQPEAFHLTAWLEEVAFLPRRLTEIGIWSRLFYTVANLYREGEADPAAREEALAQLLAGVDRGEALKSVLEVVIYLEGAVRCRAAGEAFSGPLPPPLDSEVFLPGQEPEVILDLIREALEFLASGGREPAMQWRLGWLSRHREFVDLRDFLYAFLEAVRESEMLPAPSQVLDLLQRRGFPILHQDFRDDYRAWLAPLEALRENSAALRWPLDPSSLTGDAAVDHNFTEQQEAGRRQALQSFQEGALAFLAGQENPLPRSEVVRPAAAFAVAWTVAAKLGRGEVLEAGAVAQEAANLLAPPLLRLIRPRKGYELKHKSELQHFIAEEAAIYLEALDAWGRSGHIANLHGDGLLCRLAAARSLQQRWADLAALPEEVVHHLNLPDVSRSLAELTAQLQLDRTPAGAPWWHEFQGWLKDRLGWTAILAAHQEAGDEAPAWHEAAENLFQDLARQAYRLAAAQSRHRQDLAPLPGDPGLLPWLAAWLTPLSSSLREHIRRQLLSTLRDRARQALWEAHPLRVESPEELTSLIKYFLAQELKGQDLEAYARHHRLGELIAAVARRLVRSQVPPEIMPAGGLTAAIQEVLRPRAPEVAAEQRRLEEAVLTLLPRSDCGSCGAPGCLAFARLLVRGQAAPAQCLQAPGDVKQRLEEIVAQSPAAAATEPYVLDEDDCERLGVLLDSATAALRERLDREFHGSEAQKLFPVKLDEVSILQVGKSPDAAAFHRYLEDYLGLEAAQTLSARDRAFLTEYGELRLAAEEKALEERFSWLAQESRSGLSVFALTPLDPAVQARQAYAACFFLSDLTPGDQKQVQEFRLKQYLEEFLREWERALPEHWRAGYRIEDWDDFAYIVAKSFWHQERTPASGAVLRELPHAVLHSSEAEHLAGLYLDRLVQQEKGVLEQRRQRLELLLRDRQVASPEDLRILVQGVAVRTLQQKEIGPGPDDVAASRQVQQALDLLDRAALQISGDMRLHAEDLPFRVRELLAENPHLPPGETARLESAREGLSWREMHSWQADLLRACFQAALEQLRRDDQEVERLRQGDVPLITPRLLRQAVRVLFWGGQRRVADILESLEARLAQCPDGQEWLNRLALRDYLWQLLEGGVFQKSEADASPLTKALNHLLRAHYAHDVQKLQGYMYLLARMEGDVDRLTALLREIRETSDVIEAAWLAFTEELAAQKPETAAPPPPGAPIPLSATQLPDKERFNRYLVDGLPRGEPRDYSQAYWELLTILEFYVVTAAPDDSPETMYQRFVADNYDATGLDPEAVQHALRHQARHRQRLLPRKISICTEVLAHRLAKGNPDLAHSAAEFLRQKSHLLKDEGLTAELVKGRLAAARGVELAKIKNDLYAGIADLLTDERTESFTRRIGQIIDRLEEERRDTLAALQRGELNRLTAFYILRQYQKDQERVPPADLLRFMRLYQPDALAELRARLAPEVRVAAEHEVENIMSSYQAALEE